MPTVVGVFQDCSQAERAIERMCNAGVDRDKVKLSAASAEHVAAGPVRGLAKGAAVGSLIGGMIGLLAALDEGSMRPTQVYGVYHNAREKPWAMAGVGAAVGALIGALAQWTFYKSRAVHGKICMSVEADSPTEAQHLLNLLDVAGAEDVAGGVERGNVEAAPEYEGARSQETGPVTEQKTRSGSDD